MRNESHVGNIQFWVFNIKLLFHLKGAWSYFPKFSLLFHLKINHSKDANLKFWLNWSSCSDTVLYIAVAFIFLCKLTISSNIFIDIFQAKHFPAVKFAMGNEKNMSFLVIPKSPNIWKKIEKSNWASLKCYILSKSHHILGNSQYGAPPAVRLKHVANHGRKLTSKARVIQMLHGNKCQCLFSLSI